MINAMNLLLLQTCIYYNWLTLPQRLTSDVSCTLSEYAAEIMADVKEQCSMQEGRLLLPQLPPLCSTHPRPAKEDASFSRDVWQVVLFDCFVLLLYDFLNTSHCTYIQELWQPMYNNARTQNIVICQQLFVQNENTDLFTFRGILWNLLMEMYLESLPHSMPVEVAWSAFPKSGSTIWQIVGMLYNAAICRPECHCCNVLTLLGIANDVIIIIGTCCYWYLIDILQFTTQIYHKTGGISLWQAIFLIIISQWCTK